MCLLGVGLGGRGLKRAKALVQQQKGGDSGVCGGVGGWVCGWVGWWVGGWVVMLGKYLAPDAAATIACRTRTIFQMQCPRRC